MSLYQTRNGLFALDPDTRTLRRVGQGNSINALADDIAELLQLFWNEGAGAVSPSLPSATQTDGPQTTPAPSPTPAPSIPIRGTAPVNPEDHPATAALRQAAQQAAADPKTTK